MKLAFALLLFAAVQPALLTDETLSVPPAEWRWIPFVVKQEAATFDCSFEVTSGGYPVRVELLTRPELDRFSRGSPHEFLTATAFSSRGSFRQPVNQGGEYAVLIVNGSDAQGPASVHVRLGLEFPRVRYLAPQRRLAVILISFTAFFAIVTVSARKLLRAMKLG